MSEPAIKARLSPTNLALFETVEDFHRWTACIASYGDFLRIYRETGGGGQPLVEYTLYKSAEARTALEAVLKKTLCTDGRTLFEVMREKGNIKAR